MTVLTMCAAAQAGFNYGFTGITSNDPASVATGEAQLAVEVLDVASGMVGFNFTNAGPAPCSITDVYFDDGGLLGIASIVNGPGVVFSTLASPPDLPAGNNISPPFVTTAGFSADSDPPITGNGVNPGEFVEILFTLGTGQTYANVLNQLASGELRIGIHVQSFSSGSSEAFVNTPVPAPGAFLLATLGVGSVRWSRLRRILNA